MTTEISLTKGRLALVDDADYDRLMQVGNWSCSSKGYAVHYTKIGGQRKVLYMHRVILSAPPHLQVDHINRDKLDNRRENLRLATRSQNQANHPKRQDSRMDYKGVSFRLGRYDARIKYKDKRIALGRFDDPEEAAFVYDTASRLLYWEFAGLNFPDLQASPRIERYVIDRLRAHFGT
jgi:hypothetical protein